MRWQPFCEKYGPKVCYIKDVDNIVAGSIYRFTGFIKEDNVINIAGEGLVESFALDSHPRDDFSQLKLPVLTKQINLMSTCKLN